MTNLRQLAEVRSWLVLLVGKVAILFTPPDPHIRHNRDDTKEEIPGNSPRIDKGQSQDNRGTIHQQPGPTAISMAKATAPPATMPEMRRGVEMVLAFKEQTGENRPRRSLTQDVIRSECCSTLLDAWHIHLLHGVMHRRVTFACGFQ
jgi:hypothetical protein